MKQKAKLFCPGGVANNSTAVLISAVLTCAVSKQLVTMLPCAKGWEGGPEPSVRRGVGGLEPIVQTSEDHRSPLADLALSGKICMI